MHDLMAAIVRKLDTVEELLKLGDVIRLSANTIQSQDAVLTTVFDKEECLIGIGFYEKAGDATPTHRHVGVTQYLLQYKGKCVVDFENGASRVVNVGECVKLKPGELHKVTSLTDGSEQAFVCIPAEEGYRINQEQLKFEQSIERRQ